MSAAEGACAASFYQELASISPEFAEEADDCTDFCQSWQEAEPQYQMSFAEAKCLCKAGESVAGAAAQELAAVSPSKLPSAPASSQRAPAPVPFEKSSAPASKTLAPSPFANCFGATGLGHADHREERWRCAQVKPECIGAPSNKHGASRFKPAARISMSEANARATTALTDADRSPDHEKATFAGGCFWGAEDAFAQFGKTVVGYAGGTVEHPSHTQVSRGRTGHAEAVRVFFDPARTPYTELLAAFFSCHDATQHKAKPQYRSVIFFHDAAQEQAARAALAAQTGAVLTELHPVGAFWLAAEAHQHYNAKSGRDKHTKKRRGVACGVRVGIDAKTCGYPGKDGDKTRLTSTESDPRRVSCGGS